MHTSPVLAAAAAAALLSHGPISLMALVAPTRRTWIWRRISRSRKVKAFDGHQMRHARAEFSFYPPSRTQRIL